MIISFILLIAYCKLFIGCSSINRKTLSLVSIFIYCIYSTSDYIWLVDNLRWPFHPSDPSAYYTEIYGKSFSQILHIESSNTFYYIINWLTNKFWENPFFCSLVLRLDNILTYSVAYLLVSNKCKNIGIIDLVLLFNPYVLVTIARNVRDCYIILFVVIILSALNILSNIRLNKVWLIIGCLLLYITRPILFIPVLLVIFIKKKQFLSKRIRYTIYTILIVCLIAFSHEIIIKISSQMVSAINYIGEDIEMYVPLLSGQISLPIIFSLIKRLSIGLISMMFTPHPVNFLTYWLNANEINGVIDIYTRLDNAMIFLGGVFNYVFVIPIISNALRKSIFNRYIMIFAMGFIILYVVAYIGVVDIRNRNTAIFFVMLSLLYTQQKIRLSLNDFFISGCFFIGISLISH